MIRYYNWTVKSLKLKEKVNAEFEYQALQKISNLILDGKFSLEIEKNKTEGE